MSEVEVIPVTEANRPGARGLRGWSPVLAAVEDGTRKVFQVADWIGTTGSDKPPTGTYVGATGYVSDIADAIGFEGVDGLSVRSGSGVPSNSLGINGDWYIDTATYNFYFKAAGAWSLQTSLIGTAGSTVRNGTGVPAGGLGSNGDFYIDTSTWNIYGPKSGGAWGSATSLVGPAATDPTVLTKTASYTLLVGDKVKLIRGNSASDATLTLPAAATAGDGFSFRFRNDNTGRWTIDPNGAETIDGLASINAYQGETFMVLCDGASWYTVSRPKTVTLTVPISAPVAQVDFEAMIADSEFARYEFDFAALNGSTADVFRARFKYSGVYVTTASYTGSIDYINVGASSLFARSGRLALSAPGATVANAVALFGNVNGSNVGGAYTGTPASRLEGVRFYPGSGNLASGSITLTAYR